MADTRRRRASTGRMMDEIMELARSLPLTRQVLADSLETATPAQMEFMLSWMNEELASRERSKRALFCFNVCSTGSAVFFRSVG